ncbi:hypothetical protein [Ottowia beijingensis]|nr:hypothetical protein [Ottowia beijingensis]
MNWLTPGSHQNIMLLCSNRGSGLSAVPQPAATNLRAGLFDAIC